MADELMLSPTQTLLVVESGPERFVVESTYGPGGSPPPAHFHPVQDETFEVVEGSVRTEVDGVERELASGESLEIPRGEIHRMWNSGQSAARVRWTTKPAGRTEEWFRAVDSLLRPAAEAGEHPDGAAFGVLLEEYADVFRLAPPAG